jgi:hypothetical protein
MITRTRLGLPNPAQPPSVVAYLQRMALASLKAKGLVMPIQGTAELDGGYANRGGEAESKEQGGV